MHQVEQWLTDEWQGARGRVTICMANFACIRAPAAVGPSVGDMQQNVVQV